MRKRISRREIRQIAREAYIEAKGDTKLAEELVRQKVEARYGFVDLAVIAAVLQICWILWQFWQSFQLDEITESPMEGEPDEPDVDLVG